MVDLTQAATAADRGAKPSLLICAPARTNDHARARFDAGPLPAELQREHWSWFVYDPIPAKAAMAFPMNRGTPGDFATAWQPLALAETKAFGAIY